MFNYQRKDFKVYATYVFLYEEMSDFLLLAKGLSFVTALEVDSEIFDTYLCHLLLNLYPYYQSILFQVVAF